MPLIMRQALSGATPEPANEELAARTIYMMSSSNTSVIGPRSAEGAVAARAAWWSAHRLTVAKTVCGAVLVVVLVRSFDSAALLQRISSINLLYFGVAVSMLCLQLAIFAARLHVMAHSAGGRFPLSQATIANFELAFLTQVVPSQIAGDAVRVVRAHKSGMTWTHGFSSVFLDRAIGLLTMVMVSPVILLFVPLAKLQGPLLLMTGGLLASGVVGLVALYMIGARLKHLAHNRVAKVVIAASDTLKALLKDPGLAAFALIVSLIGHACSAVAACLIAQGLKIDLAFWSAVPALALVHIAMMVPLSIGGWGVREAAAVFVLGLIGVAAADSLAIAIVYGLASSVVGLIGGLVWLRAGYNTTEVQSEILRAAPLRQENR